VNILSLKRPILLLYLTLLGTLPTTAVSAQVASFWQSNTPDGDWFVVENWSSGIPNGLDDTAFLVASPTFVPPALTSPVTLGSLMMLGSLHVEVVGEELLTFSSSGDYASLQFQNSSSGLIRSPISVPSGGLLRISVSHETGELTLGGEIASTGGNIEKSGEGRLKIAGASPNWSGTFTVHSGAVLVEHADALGSAAGPTILHGGTLQVAQAMSEPIIFAGGELESVYGFQAFNVINYFGALDIPSSETGVVRGSFNLRGGTTGEGDLQILADNARTIRIFDVPMNHLGDLTLKTSPINPVNPHPALIYIDVDNSYAGFTTLDNVRLEVWTPDGLGSPDVGTLATNNSRLRLHHASREPVVLEHSVMLLSHGTGMDAQSLFEGTIAMRSSTLTTQHQGGARPTYAIVNPVVLNGGLNSIQTGESSTSSNIGGFLRIEGGITGSGDLTMVPRVDITVVSPIDIDGSVAILGGSGFVRFASPDVYKGKLYLAGGRLIAEANQHFSRVETSSLTECCGPSPGIGWIEAAAGAMLSTDSVGVYRATLKGDIRTPSAVEFHSIASQGTIMNVHSGLDVQLNSGRLVINDRDASLPSSNIRAVVNRERDAAVFLTTHMTTHTDFYLNNASGFANGGALRSLDDSTGAPTITLKGNIYLGDQGAVIGGPRGIRMEGNIFGGDLTLNLNQQFVIAGESPVYTGKTVLRSGELTLTEAGRLTNTSRIEVFPGARLAIELTSADGSLANRIANDIPIDLFGGEVGAFVMQGGISSAERLGDVTLKRGVSHLHGSQIGSGANLARGDLIVGNLTREPGALAMAAQGRSRVTPGTGTSQKGLILENPVPLVNGILPAWILGGSTVFATYDADGRIAEYSGPTTLLSSAVETSIARPPTGPSVLSDDKTIHALYAYGNTGPVDLMGHTLTVGSGGVSGARLSNGVIQPGQYSDGELIFFGGATINADIVDNGAPTSVIYASEAQVGGNSSYSGKTYVMNPQGPVWINRGNALPLGGDVEVVGSGTLHLRDLAGFDYELGSIKVRDGGSFTAQCCSNNYTTTVSAERIELEGGRLSLPLVGDVPIAKTTSGIAELSYLTAMEGYTGTIDVYDGILSIADRPGLHQATITVHEGGRLALKALAGGFAPGRLILNGGTLYAGNMVGDIEVIENSQIVMLDGTATDYVLRDMGMEGAIHVASGKTLELVGSPIRMRALQITEGLHLESGAVYAGVGGILGSVDISNGGIISPGSTSPDSPLGTLGSSRAGVISDPVSRMTWGEEGRYRWEINDAEGRAGGIFGNGWDLVNVKGILDVQATSAQPFVIEVVSLGNDGGSGQVANLALGEHRWLIAQAQELIGFDPSKFTIDTSEFWGLTNVSLGAGPTDSQATSASLPATFWLEQAGHNIYLHAHVVPEPSAVMMAIVIGCLALVGARPHILASTGK